MYEHPITQANMEKLKSAGYEFVDPVWGELVCGSEGTGHIQDPAFIVERVVDRIGPKAGKKARR